MLTDGIELCPRLSVAKDWVALLKIVIPVAIFLHISLSSQRSSDYARIKKKGKPFQIFGDPLGRPGLFCGPHEFT